MSDILSGAYSAYNDAHWSQRERDAYKGRVGSHTIVRQFVLVFDIMAEERYATAD